MVVEQYKILLSKSWSCIVSAAIDIRLHKYNKPYSDGIFLKYSSHELVNKINNIKHPIIREVFKKLKF